MGLFYDSTYLLVILAALISMAVSVRMNTIFSKYQTVRSYSGMTGREAAMRILHQAGIYDVTVRHVSGKLTDHYDPRTKTVNLSDAVYDSTSVAAIGVAAHECGHAVQHNTDYVPLKVRSAIVPAANLGSQLFWPLFLIGLIFSLPMPDKLRFCRQRPLPRKGIKSLQSRNLDKDKNNERKDRTMGQMGYPSSQPQRPATGN